jgi:hypothetical protein
VAFKPSLKRKHVPGDEELDMTPIMNLVVVLIPLLLATAEFVKLGLLETRLPPSAAGAASTMPEELAEPKEKLGLLVSVDEGGVSVSIFGATAGSENADGHYSFFPRRADGTLDYPALSGELLRVRSEIVVPSILGRVQNEDPRGKPIFNPDGSPQMVDEYSYDDAETVIVSAPNELPFHELVTLLDHTREWRGPDGRREMLFPTPLLGKVQ